MWKTRLECEKNKVHPDIVENVCVDIEQKDDSFRYEAKDGDIIIYSESEDQAYQRGAWFRRNVDFRITYKVYLEMD